MVTKTRRTMAAMLLPKSSCKQRTTRSSDYGHPFGVCVQPTECTGAILSVAVLAGMVAAETGDRRFRQSMQQLGIKLARYRQMDRRPTISE